MKIEVHEGIIKGIPIALLVTFLLQGAGAVWWVSGKSRDTYFLSQRVANLETVLLTHSKSEDETHVRLARIEERVTALVALMDRIDKQIQTSHR